MGDFATGKTAIESSQGYHEMESAIPVSREVPGTDIEENREQVLRDAADGLTKLRGEDRPDAKPIVERTYTELDTGRPKPANETLSVEQASSDLTGVRQREQITTELDEAAEVARAIDQLRGETSESPGVEPAQPLPTQQQQQQQPEVQPQAVDEDWQRMLSGSENFKCGSAAC
ncbi:MAG: hypothetical protein WA728_12505 [Xanthobacteraceae bacterium]